MPADGGAATKMSLGGQGPTARFSRRETLRNGGWFLGGKLLSALATIAWLTLVSRALLPPGQFAAYVSAIAYLETALALSLFGLDWLLIRRLPAALAAGDGGGLRRLLRQALLARAACAGGIALMLLGLSAWLGMPPALAGLPMPLLAGLLLSEALLRLLRDTALESLGAQRYTQLGVLGRTLLTLSGLLLLGSGGGALDAATVLGIELVASLLVLGCAAAWVGRACRALPTAASAEVPAFWSSWLTCWHNYLAALISYPLAPQALLLMVSSFAGNQVTASFGLLVRVFELLRNYVPGLLLMNVLRPRLIARHAALGDFDQVAAEAAAISRWSAISLAPVLALLALYGDGLLGLIAGQPMAGMGLPLAMMAATLLFRVHRQFGQVMVNCTGETRLLSHLALLGLAGWPLGALLAWQGQAVWGAVLILAWDELAWVVAMSWGLRRRGHVWSTQVGLLSGLLLLAAANAGFLAWLQLPRGAAGVAAGVILTLVLMFGVLHLAGLLDWRGAWKQLRVPDQEPRC